MLRGEKLDEEEQKTMQEILKRAVEGREEELDAILAGDDTEEGQDLAERLEGLDIGELRAFGHTNAVVTPTDASCCSACQMLLQRTSFGPASRKKKGRISYELWKGRGWATKKRAPLFRFGNHGGKHLWKTLDREVS